MRPSGILLRVLSVAAMLSMISMMALIERAKYGAPCAWPILSWFMTCDYVGLPGILVNVRRASDNLTKDIGHLTNGLLDSETAAKFAGVDATCTGTINGNIARLKNCSSMPHASDPVLGKGIVQPAWVRRCFITAEGAAACRLNAAQNIDADTTLTFQVALFVTKLYDQAGNGDVQETDTDQWKFLPDCGGGFPCLGIGEAHERSAMDPR